jgi:1-acyl-sn-glycerol-3-phosphate acyltransferase
VVAPKSHFWRAKHWFLRKALRFIVPLSFDVSIKSRQNMPVKSPFIIVSNHRYDLDAFLISYAVESPILWVAAKFLTHIPVVAQILKLFDMVTVSRGRGDNHKSISRMIRYLKRGANLGIFPEGMDYLIAADFTKPMTAFYKGFCKISALTGVPVYPVAIIPKRERVIRYPIPKSIRKIFGVTPDLQDVPFRNIYVSLTLSFGAPVFPREDLSREEACADVHDRTRAELQRLLAEGRA